jgi:hypothetical protein
LPVLSAISPQVAATVDGSEVYIAQYSGNVNYVYRSRDRGINWSTVGNLGRSPQSALLAGGAGLVLVGKYEGTLSRSTNSGGSWSSITISDRPVVAIESDSTGGIWLGTDSVLYRSRDRGASFERIADMPGLKALAVDPAGRLLVGTAVDTGMYIRITADSGTTWQASKLIPNDPAPFVGRGITGLVAADYGRIFVGTIYNGIFVSRDSGATWQQANDQLSGVLSLGLTSTGQVLGSITAGLFTLSEEFTLPHDEPDDVEPPTETKLNLPYPNPFQESILIPYELAHDVRVRIEVFNTAGELVERLLDEHAKAGRYGIIWEAAYQANGYYFVRMRADGVMMSLPVVLMR